MQDYPKKILVEHEQPDFYETGHENCVIHLKQCK